MNLNYSEHPDATSELLDTIKYYHGQRPGLGDEFNEAVLAAIKDAVEAPLAWPKMSFAEGADARRRKVTGFPYQVVYIVRDNALVVLAYAHERRRPGYWSDRVRD